MNPFSLTDKVALVTGGSGVLGTAMCQALAAAGARVAVLGRREEGTKKVSTEIQKLGGRAMAVQADVLRKEDLLRAKEIVEGELGSIDILVNAAGGNQRSATIQPLQSIADVDMVGFQQVMDINLMGTVLPSKFFAESMMMRKKGVIINITSMSAQRPLTRVVGYSAAKAAVENFTKWLAVELAHKGGEGIRVNAIAPGFFLTEQNRELLTNADGSLTDRGKQIVDHTPFKRFGVPKELGGTLVWLCSDASKFVTGTIIPVDGGFGAYSGV